MTATHSVQIGDEVYVYVRGRLVMKRWLRHGYSVMVYEAGPPRTSFDFREHESRQERKAGL